jgi:hypothetical protein
VANPVVARRGRQGRIIVDGGTYERLCEINGEFCWLCGKPPKTRRLHIDHDHRTLEVRGLLCFQCNRRLPKGTTAVWLRRAAWYLEGTSRTEAA